MGVASTTSLYKELGMVLKAIELTKLFADSVLYFIKGDNIQVREFNP